MTIVDNPPARARSGSPHRTGAPEPAVLLQPGITHSPGNTPRHDACNLNHRCSAYFCAVSGSTVSPNVLGLARNPLQAGNVLTK